MSPLRLLYIFCNHTFKKLDEIIDSFQVEEKYHEIIQYRKKWLNSFTKN